FARPNTSDDFVLQRIDLHERARANDGIKGVIVGPDITIKHFLWTRLLTQEKGHFAQTLKHTMDKIRPFQGKLSRQLRRGHDKRFRWHKWQPAQMSVWQVDMSPLFAKISDIETEQGQDLVDIAIVNETETVKLR